MGMKLHERISELATWWQARGLYLDDIAARGGVCEVTLYHARYGHHEPRAETLVRLARCFEVPVHLLLEGVALTPAQARRYRALRNGRE